MMKVTTLSWAFALIWATTAFGADQLGLRNFRELPAAYEEATHVDSNMPEIQAVYKKVLTRLPIKGQVEEMSSPMILAVAELAGAYCQQLVVRESAKPPAERESFATVKFDRGLSQFSPSSQKALINEVALLFWQRNATSAEADRFMASWADFAAASSTSSADTGKWMRALCAQFGSSLEFLAKR